MKLKQTAACLLAAAALAACDSQADKIGNASTVFNLLGKNDRIEIEGFDDEDVQGLTCYLSYAKKAASKKPSTSKKTPATPPSPACRPLPLCAFPNAPLPSPNRCSNAVPASCSKACR